MDVRNMLVLGLTTVACFRSCCGKAPTFDHKIGLPTKRPLNIGHRGSAGTHPEHTVAAYQQAIDDGADVIECDIYVTKDLQLVCLHAPNLTPHTDIASRPEFGDDRQATHDVPESGVITDWFCFDFTLEELKTLRVVQHLTFRDQKFNGQFQISTFDEHVAVAKNADRIIGIYPEPKLPAFVNSLSFMNGTRVEDLLLEALEKHGYTDADDPCIVQRFDENSLKYMNEKSDLPMVIMVWKDEHYLGPYLNDSKIQEWGSMFYGFGAWKTQVINYYDTPDPGYKNWINGQTNLVQQVKEAGMKFHLYTFRNEDRYLAWDFSQDPYEEYIYFMQLGFDGYVTDFPKTFDRVLDEFYREEVECVGAAPGRQTTFGVVLSFVLMACFIR